MNDVSSTIIFFLRLREIQQSCWGKQPDEKRETVPFGMNFASVASCLVESWVEPEAAAAGVLLCKPLEKLGVDKDPLLPFSNLS